MPNHVTNLVHMRGIGTRKELFRETEDGDVNLDFEKIIPIPGEDDLLNVPSPMDGFTIDLAMKALVTRISAMPLYKYNGKYRKFFELVQNIKLEAPRYYEGKEAEALEHGLQYINNIIKHGYPTWYEWCTSVWGTKWNSYCGEIIDDNTINFTTAWDIPYNIYILMSSQYPNDEIIVEWFNEGGCFGHTHFLDGEMIEEKVYTFTDDFIEEEDNNRLFHKVQLLEERSTF